MNDTEYKFKYLCLDILEWIENTINEEKRMCDCDMETEHSEDCWHILIMKDCDGFMQRIKTIENGWNRQ